MAILRTESHGIDQGHSGLNSRRLVQLNTFKKHVFVERETDRNQNKRGCFKKESVSLILWEFCEVKIGILHMVNGRCSVIFVEISSAKCRRLSPLNADIYCFCR